MSAFKKDRIVDKITSFLPISNMARASLVNTFFRDSYRYRLKALNACYVYRANHGGVLVRYEVHENDDDKESYVSNNVIPNDIDMVVAADNVYTFIDGIVVMKDNKMLIIHNRFMINKRFFRSLAYASDDHGATVISTLNALLQGVIENGLTLSATKHDIIAISGENVVYKLPLKEEVKIGSNEFVQAVQYDDMDTTSD